MSFKLKGFGYDPITAEDCPGAIQKVRKEKPDLILLDLNFRPDIPHGGGVGWDGFLLLSWLRRIDNTKQTPVIAITGAELEQYKNRCLEAGILDLFRKPVDHAALVESIRAALSENVPALEPEPSSQSTILPADEATPVEPPPGPESPTRRRILFVDDENDWRYMGSLYLTECGYEVSTTADAVGALAQANTITPDVVVLDLNLDGESGVTLMKLLAVTHPRVPILIYTGRELCDAEIMALLDQGASECLQKGTMDELLAAVGRALGEPPGKLAVVPKPTDGETALEYLPEESTEPSLTTVDGPLSATSEETTMASGSTQAFEYLPEETTEPSLPAAESPLGALPDEVIESGIELVLIVSEDIEFGGELRSFLESNSFRVTGVTDGTEAMTHISEVEVDFILFDMALPSPSAERFYQAVESTKPHLCKRIIFMTNDDVDPKSDGFVRRAKGTMLWRPFPLEDLLQTAQTIRSQFIETV